MLVRIDSPSPQTPAGGAAEDAARVEERLVRTMLGTVVDHGLIEQGDRILVAVSGGKDSATLIDLLVRARRRAPVSFDLVAFHLDQGQPGHDPAPLEVWLRGLGVPYEIHREDTYSEVVADAERNPGATLCRLCSRLRRGILYSAAERFRCGKVALGHHRDDALETLLLNLFYSGRLQSMPAIYKTHDGRLRVIRPLVECAERDIALRAAALRYPILPCNLCGSQKNLKRDRMARLLAELEREIPDLRSVMLAAIRNVRPSHLLDREVAASWERAAHEYRRRR